MRKRLSEAARCLMYNATKPMHGMPRQPPPPSLHFGKEARKEGGGATSSLAERKDL